MRRRSRSMARTRPARMIRCWSNGPPSWPSGFGKERLSTGRNSPTPIPRRRALHRMLPAFTLMVAPGRRGATSAGPPRSDFRSAGRARLSGRLPAAARGRPGRHGRRVRGPADFAQMPGRPQGPSLRLGNGHTPTSKVPDRSPSRRVLAPFEHRPRLRGWYRTGHSLLCDAVHRGPQPR